MNLTTRGSLATLLQGLAETPAEVHFIPPGTLVDGRFRVGERLGRGGMAVVYRAYDEKLERHVALKLEKQAQRTDLLKEARSLARVSHPNVITAYEVGEFRDSLYAAVELVEGTSAREWLAAAPRGVREIVELYRAAGVGLAAIHRAGLVHRDFKPENVLCGTDGRVRVADLGLAEAPGGGGGPAGTVPYMAPEQHEGAALDARADQWAFAASLWEALLGVAPFDGATLEEIARAKRSRSPREPPTTRLPRWLRAALLRALAPLPAHRHPSMDALAALLGDDPWARRRRRLAFAATAFAAAGAAFAVTRVVGRGPLCEVADAEVATIWGPASARRLETAFTSSNLPYAPVAYAAVARGLGDYAEAWRGQRLEACRDTRERGAQSEELLDRRVACLERRRAAARDLVAVLEDGRRELVAEAAAAVARLPEMARCADHAYLAAVVAPPEPAIAARVNETRAFTDQATARFRAGDYRGAEARLIWLIPEVNVLGYAPLEAEVFYQLGAAQSWSESKQAAPASLERAFFAARRSGHDEVAATAAIDLADLYGYELARLDLGKAWADHARAEVAHSAAGTRAEAELMRTLGLLEGRQGHHQRAIVFYRRAIEVLRRLGEDRNPLAPQLLTHIAADLGTLGRVPEAIAAGREALALRDGVLALSHPDNVNTLAILSGDLLEIGARGPALHYAFASMAIAHASLGRHPKTAFAIETFGAALEALGSPAAARAELERSLAMFEATRPPGHPNLGWIHIELGMLLARQGSAALGVEHIRRGLEVRKKAFGEHDPTVADALLKLGSALVLAGRAEEALDTIAQAQALHDEVNPDGAGTAELLVERGRALLALGRRADAEEALARGRQLAAVRGLAPLARDADALLRHRP